MSTGLVCPSDLTFGMDIYSFLVFRVWCCLYTGTTGTLSRWFEIDRLIADRGAYTLWNVLKLAPYRTLFLQVPDLITERVWVDTLITHAL